MSVITPTIVQSDVFDENATIYTWAGITESDTCAPIGNLGFTIRSVQFEGTFGGATIVAQGSNDGTNYRTVKDPQGNAISKTSAGLSEIQEPTRYLNISASGGTGQSLTATLVVVRRGL